MPTALIADDEPLLAQALSSELAHIWPQLQVLEHVADGVAAVERALALRPDLLFLDFRMPGLGGLEAARELAQDWPAQAPFPAIVFVTAYDQYAVQAFELQAVDYLLKPVSPARLQSTVDRLRRSVENRHADPDAVLDGLRRLLSASAPAAAATPYLSTIQAAVGAHGLHVIPVEQVLWFEAADKYVRVLTAEREYLIRTPLKELLARLDPQQFWQVHRGSVVRASAIEAVDRDASGRMHLTLRGCKQRVPVSRLHAGLFKPM
ncbi:LytTR family DNA-binding domain-containing protein [Ramlibacter sp. AN1015]|uniref:LytR/AlgR family response regulator transcription factor n=1 Tax=Ramlibacter sp. AN1015 TaxID=3133428 RepID=UPI0030BC378A